MYIVGAGDTSVTLYCFIRDPATGFAKTGLLYNSAGAAAAYTRPKAAAIPFSLASLASPSAAWTSGGFVEVDNTNAKGLYRIDPPDGAFAAGVGYSIVSLDFTNGFCPPLEVVLDPMPDVISGTVQTDGTNSATTFKLNLPSVVDDFYNNGWWLFRTGRLAGQVKEVTDYVGSTGRITVASPGYTATPGVGDSGVFINR